MAKRKAKKTWVFDEDKINDVYARALATAKEQTAADVRSRARRYITIRPIPGSGDKLTGKQKRMLAGEHSRPGQPPFSQTGRLTRIEYVRVGDDWIVGPVQFQYAGEGHDRFTWGVLEHGGRTGRSYVKVAKPRNRRKLRSRGELPPLSAPGKKRKKRSPPARQAEREALRSRKERPKGWRYFFSAESRAAATSSPRLQAYFKNMAPEKKVIPPCQIAARPFMSKAFETEANESRILKRVARAMKEK